jgi:glycosyltransferase involved in cell wall biosynthesis
MRIVQICPGSGDTFYCENCLRDAALVRGLRRLGHEVLVVPLYLIFFGGINVYLQQKFALFRKTPRWLDRCFDSRRLLGWAARKAGMTSARSLGETTISMLHGEHGRQVKELDRLVEWLRADQPEPDIVCLSNVLLAGMARRLKEKLGVPVVCLLQDEDGFLDGLTPPYVGQAWGIVGARARDINAFFAVSRYFADVMQERLKSPADRMHVVRPGIEPGEYKGNDREPAVPTVGFLSRLCPDRGLERLIDAFVRLKRDEKLRPARLRLCGGRTGPDEPFLRRLRAKLAVAGILADVEFLSAFDHGAKLEFLRSLSVLSVPEPKPVACGLYVLEALAMGVPVVEPALGCFPETLALTGGGLLYEPNTAERLAEVMAPLLLDASAARRLGAEGRAGVGRTLHIEKTAGEMIHIFEQMIRKSQRGPE